MDSELVPFAPIADSAGDDLYQRLGGTDACQKLAATFYAHVEHDPLLRPLYPPILTGCPIKALAAFLTQFLGGPCDYAPRRWYLSLREAHLRFKIGPKEREAWLNDMFQAVDEMNIEEPIRGALRWFFAQSSAFLVNQPPGAAHTSTTLEHPVQDHNEPETSRMHREIAQRWQTQQTLEEIVAAVRQGNAEHALTMLEHPTLQAYFIRDRAAFLSVLAILSSSQQSVLLDYVRQVLTSNPDVIKERSTYDCTLLHEVAGQGNLAIVELLLHLGADPNATDQWGHTPLYFVSNTSHEANHAKTVHLLVESGANVNAQEKGKHSTALHMAARRGNVLVAEALLDCGADAEARDKLGDTPLHRAVKCGKTEMVAFLLSRGVDAHAPGKGGLTPWQVARGRAMKHLLQSSFS